MPDLRRMFPPRMPEELRRPLQQEKRPRRRPWHPQRAKNLRRLRPLILPGTAGISPPSSDLCAKRLRTGWPGCAGEIAEDYDSVQCETVREDRSGKVVLTDGTEVPYTWYYDLVQIRDDNYPLADEINAVLEAQKDAFFSGEQTNPSTGIGGVITRAEGDYQDYVGEAGIYSGKGILSIRMAEIRSAGLARAGFFRGKTFRLSDGKELTLADVTDRTDSGLKHLVKKKIREWFENEGYSSVSMSDVEDYIDQTAPEELKFCIREDGIVYLAVDQEMPFFTGAGEILEIPLN